MVQLHDGRVWATMAMTMAMLAGCSTSSGEERRVTKIETSLAVEETCVDFECLVCADDELDLAEALADECAGDDDAGADAAPETDANLEETAVVDGPQAPPDGIGDNDTGWWGPLGGSPPRGPWPGLTALLAACPLGGDMPYCHPTLKMPGVRCEPFTFNCVDFNVKLGQCLAHAVSVYGNPFPLTFFNTGNDLCCNVKTGAPGPKGGHSALVACNAQSQSCCILDGQGRTRSGGGVRGCFAWKPGTTPEPPAELDMVMCPAGTYSCGKRYPVQAGLPAGNGGDSAQACRDVFRTKTGLDLVDPTPACKQGLCDIVCQRYDAKACGGAGDVDVEGSCATGTCSCIARNATSAKCTVTGLAGTPSCACPTPLSCFTAEGGYACDLDCCCALDVARYGDPRTGTTWSVAREHACLDSNHEFRPGTCGPSDPEERRLLGLPTTADECAAFNAKLSAAPAPSATIAP